jgi:hypothetical protein
MSYELPNIVLPDLQDTSKEGVENYLGTLNQAISQRDEEIKTRLGRLGSFIDVRDYGAIGDGVADDSGALSAAIADAGSGPIFLPTGTFLLSSNISSSLNGVHIVGAGRNLTIIRYSATSGNIFTFSGIGFMGRDFMIQGPGTGGSEVALVLDGNSRYYLDNVVIQNVGGACLKIDPQYAKLVRSQFNNSGGDLIRVQNAGGAFTIDSCYLTGAVNNGIDFDANATNMSIRDSNIEACDYGIYMGATAAVVLFLDSCHLEANATADVRTGSGCDSLNATCTRFGSSTPGRCDTNIKIANAATHLIFDSCKWRGADTYCIDADTAANITMRGNNQGFDKSKVNGSGIFHWPEIYLNGEIATSTVSTSGTGEDDLHSIDIPQYSHNVHRTIKLIAAGTKTGSNGTKTISLHWGSVSYQVCAAANNTNGWRVEATITIRDNNSQVITWKGYDGNTLLQGYEAGTQDLAAGSVTLKLTGECADAGDQINNQLWNVQVY